MTPGQLLFDETREWLVRAQGDLGAADLLLQTLPAEALFHCQQAAEKFLKAFLTWNQIPFRKTHLLRELGVACAAREPSLGPVLGPAYALSEYAWKFRYPGAPYGPNSSEAERARALAEVVRQEILKRLPPDLSVAAS